MNPENPVCLPPAYSKWLVSLDFKMNHRTTDLKPQKLKYCFQLAYTQTKLLLSEQNKSNLCISITRLSLSQT